MQTLTVPNDMEPGAMAEWVRTGEAAFADTLQDLSATLLRQPDISLLGLTGPTCSGKTTAAAMLTQVLEAGGRSVHIISLDDFFYSKEILQRASLARGRTEPDYDSPQTIDLDLLRSCVSSLLAGKETRMPRFHFRTGRREQGDLLRPAAGDVFLFEGIQILYPQVDALLRRDGYVSLCICPQTAIETGGERFTPNEIRLMRRLVRDVIYRGATPAFTFSVWESVRANEETHIFPYIQRCNRTVDSTMPYEIGLLKPYLERYLTGDGVAPFEREAQAILARLRSVQPVPASLIGPDSLYKEFI